MPKEPVYAIEANLCIFCLWNPKEPDASKQIGNCVPEVYTHIKESVPPGEDPKYYLFHRVMKIMRDALEMPKGVEWLQHSISLLGLSHRAKTACDQLGIYTIGQLIQCGPDVFLKMRNVGDVSVNEIKAKLSVLGLEIADDEKEPRTDGAGSFEELPDPS